MTEEENTKVQDAVTNSILNSLNINGILEAVKIYSVNVANQQFKDMSEEDKQRILENIKAHEAGQNAEQSVPVGYGTADDSAVG